MLRWFVFGHGDLLFIFIKMWHFDCLLLCLFTFIWSLVQHFSLLSWVCIKPLHKSIDCFVHVLSLLCVHLYLVVFSVFFLIWQRKQRRKRANMQQRWLFHYGTINYSIYMICNTSYGILWFSRRTVKKLERREREREGLNHFW